MAHLSDSLQAELKAYLRDYFKEAIVNPKPQGRWALNKLSFFMITKLWLNI